MQAQSESFEPGSIVGEDSILPADQQVVLILVGLIGSGKSTFARALERYFPDFCRCSQDDLGDRRSVEALARRALRDGRSVCIDRTNFDESQRATWINIAFEFPHAQPWVLVFDVPYEICAARITERTGHPTITSPELGLQVLQRFRTQYRPPAPHEGYTRILHLAPSDCPDSEYSAADVRDVMRRLRDSPEVASIAPPLAQYGGYQRGSYHQRGPQRGFPDRSRGYSSGRGTPSYRGSGYSPARYGRDGMQQSTLPWARQGGESSRASAGSGYEHAFAARRSGYQAGDESRPDYDRRGTEGDWRR